LSLQIKNSKSLLGEELRLKMLLVGLPGTGKTTFLSTAPNIGIGACETGSGRGLASIAEKGIDYVELDNYGEFDQFCSGNIFKDKSAVGLDSLSTMTKTFIKDYALSLPRSKGQSQKRAMGVPELDDYGTMGEVTRRLLAKLIDQPKHVLATATLLIKSPDAETGLGELMIGPDLPGQMFLGATAMFDIVLVCRTRVLLRDPKDAKSRFTQHYWITQGGNGVIAKCRYAGLKAEEIYNPATGEGTFPDLLAKIKKAATPVAEAA